jgi:hypothetical protein
MKHEIISAILLVCFTTTTIARAEELTKLPKIETPYGEIDPGEAISPMKRDQRAPFTGVLLSPKAVAKIIVDLKSLDDRVKLEVKQAVETQNIICLKEKNEITIKSDADRSILNASIQEKLRTISLYEDQLKKETNKTDPGTLVGIGAVLGAVLTTLTALAVSQMK